LLSWRQGSLWNCIAEVLRQFKAERNLLKRHVSYRTTQAARVAEAYGSMSADEFDAINGPQEWQNRRFIPRVIQSFQLREPVLAVDLGCGSGQSSQVLGSQLPHGSTIVGYDICDRLLARAGHRAYRDVLGAPLKATFVNQSIAEPLQNPEGSLLDAESVGLLHAAGVVGHHLAEADVRAMAAEIARVLMPTGWVVLDAGPAMPRGRLQKILAEHGLAVWKTLRAVPCASHHMLIFQRRRRGLSNRLGARIQRLYRRKADDKAATIVIKMTARRR
jgi:SAM-dependent methyltransferase